MYPVAFCVLTDARRPELIEAWYEVMKCVRPIDLRIRCKVPTWQELAKGLPRSLREFPGEKYGIEEYQSTIRADNGMPKAKPKSKSQVLGKRSLAAGARVGVIDRNG
jgi:restriction endonuclease-like protein